MPRLDIAIILPDLRGGGAEKVTVNLVRGLVEGGAAVEVVLFQKRGELLAEMETLAPVFGLEAERLRDGFRPLVAYFKDRSPRAVLSTMWPVTSLSAAAGVLAGRSFRHVMAEHTNWERSPITARAKGRLAVRATMGVTHRMADAVVTVSEGAADSLARVAGLPRSRVQVIYNPVTPLPPLGEVDRSLAPAWFEGPEPRLVSVGSFKPAKDYALLLEAVARVRRRRPVKLLLLGEGELRGDLERQRTELGLENAVFMPGFAPNPHAYVASADLFVLSSAWEGLPTAIIEALACGVPVVSTDCRSGPREILLDGKLGDLVALGDPDALAAAIASALDRKPDRQALVERSADFSIDRAVKAYRRLLLPDQTSEAKA